MTDIDLSRELCDFIEKSPTSFHAVATMAGDARRGGLHAS